MKKIACDFFSFEERELQERRPGRPHKSLTRMKLGSAKGLGYARTNLNTVSSNHVRGKKCL